MGHKCIDGPFSNLLRKRGRWPSQLDFLLRHSHNGRPRALFGSCRMRISQTSIQSGARPNIARNAGLLVWDMLYGIDANLQVQRQMVEAEEVSADGLTWTFHLRPGLKFHDGEPVLARDVAASLERWTARDQMGLLIRAIQQELTATDDRTVKWVLKKPFPKMLLALGKISTPIAFIMPERIAKTDPFKQISEYVGSGPMRFLKDEWVPGAKAAFELFPDYAPRSEPGSWLA